MLTFQSVMVGIMKFKVFFVVIILLADVLHVSCLDASSNSFTTFGGSVKWHNSDASIKQFVSQLKIHVHSLPDDTLRQVVHVLPNGAYSVVVSDKGRYRIRLSTPSGWNFIPSEGYVIDLNESTQDVQMSYTFDLTGFDVSGQVVTTGMNTGPSDLVITAISSDGAVVSHTKTISDGSFTLISVPPGEYLITVGDSVSNNKDGIRASTSVTVSTTSVKLTEPLVLEGHSLRSQVTFNSEGVANIPVLLLISKSNQIGAADLKKLGCSRPIKPLTDLIPAELKDRVNPNLACQTVSGSDGSFSYSRLAGGAYFLVAYHDSSLMKSSEIKSSHLELSPSFLSVTMEHADRQIDSGFQVISYRLSGGKVKQASGKPIANAEIILNGSPVTKTDSSGLFKLDLFASAQYEIQVKAPGLKFDKVSVKLTPATESLPTFVPKEVEVCGRFILSNSLRTDTRFPSVEVVSGPAIQPSVSGESKSAKFCAYLSPGKHTLRLAKASNFVNFAPSSINVDLSSGPVSDLVFFQFQAVLTGEVNCIDKCPVSNLAIRLSSSDQTDSEPVVVHLDADIQDEKRATFSFKSVTPGTYDLELLTKDGNQASGWCWYSPGLIRHIKVSDRDLHNTPELIFQQSGYRLHVNIPLLDYGFSKPIDLKVSPQVEFNGSSTPRKPLFYRFTKPLSSICLPDGSFSFEASTACLKLETPSPSRVNAVDIPISLPSKPLSISVREIPVRAVVTTEPGVEESSLPELTIQAKITGGVVQKSFSKWEKESDVFVSHMNLWASPDSEVVFSVSPAKPPSDTDKIHPLIHPTSQTLRVPSFIYPPVHSMNGEIELEGSSTVPPKIDESECNSALETAFGGSEHLTSTFSMKSGFFFTGSVQPAVENALVTVFANTSVVLSPSLEVTSKMTKLFSEQELNSASPKPGFTLASRALTNAQGTFRIGPFYFEKLDISSNSLLTVSIQKPGFEFIKKTPTDLLNFKAIKLALVEIRVVSEESRKPLPDTLVSIIGSVYRDSGTTDSMGFVRYIGLPPGEYYMQPMLKEYEFFVLKESKGPLEHPMEHPLSVVDGESMSVELVGRRVAYSAFGEVTSLFGHPEDGVLIQAKLLSLEEMKTYADHSVLPIQDAEAVLTCQAHSKETALVHPVEQSYTDNHGFFKILGLLPGCPYLVSASRRENASDYQVRQAFPASIICKPLRADVHNIRFFLKPRVSMGMVSATVATDSKYLPELSLVIRSTSQPQNPLIRHSFASSLFFSLLGSDVENLIGGTYLIQLEAESKQAQGQKKLIQKYEFSVDKTSFGAHQHFAFAYSPGQ
nr:nodal modulator 1 [Hymenolepis microstoma]